MFCRNCGNEIGANAAVCIHCGVAAGVGNKFCRNCASSVDPIAAVCLKCGAAQQPSAGSALPGQAKSKLLAGLLGIFLGGFGVHRFYLGYNTIGVIQLLVTVVGGLVTCGFGWIAGFLWGFIEGILILAGQIARDAQGNALAE